MQYALASPQAAEGNYHGLKKFVIWAFILLSLDTLKAFCMSIRNHFFRSVNAIVGKVGRAASDEVILQHVFSKCIPVLLYGLESMSLTRSDEKSLDFTFNRFMMKLFGTTDINVIKDCQVYFGTQPPSEILTKRRCKFLEQYRNSSNSLCRYFCG